MAKESHGAGDDARGASRTLPAQLEGTPLSELAVEPSRDPRKGPAAPRPTGETKPDAAPPKPTPPAASGHGATTDGPGPTATPPAAGEPGAATSASSAKNLDVGLGY